MKINRKIIVLAIAAAVVSWTMPAFAQDDGDGENATSEDSSQSRVRPQKADRLINQLLRNPDDAPESLKLQILDLRDSQDSLRDAWIEDFRPGDDATADEIKSARVAFQAEYAEDIRTSRELRLTVMRDLRAGLRDAIDDSTWNEQARELYSEYKKSHAELGEAWKAVRSELGEDATREEIKAARERFNEANADLISQQKRLAKQVRNLIRENRSDRSVPREALPQELQDLRSDMSTLRDQVRSRQRQARDDMREMNRGEREQYRRALLEELKDLHDEIKQRRREIIDEIQDGQSGDRRPEG